jgi:hypothetical protein
VVGTRTAEVIPDNKAMRLRAKSAFTDVYGKKHTLGEEYLVTPSISNSRITKKKNKQTNKTNKKTNKKCNFNTPSPSSPLFF